jgi:hypothetical protein
MVFAFQDGSNPSAPGATSGINDLAAQYGINLSGSDAGIGPGSTNDPFVFMGEQKITKYSTATSAEHIMATGGPVQGSKLSDLQRQFIQLSEDKKRHWAYLLALTGYADASIAADPAKAAEFAKTAPLNTVLQMHQNFLQDAADQFNLYRRKVTPTALMNEMLSYRLGKNFPGDLNAVVPGGSGSAATSHTQTSKSIDYLNPEDAKGMVRNMLQQQLGRDPSQAEYEDFVATIHAAERQNPSTSTTTYNTDAEGNTTNSSTVTHGGLTSSGYDQLLYDKAKSLPSWAVWQAVGTYAPALFQALDAPVSGV